MKKQSLLVAIVAMLTLAVGASAYYSTDWFLAASLKASKNGVSQKECQTIKRYFDQGVLTKKYPRLVAKAATCAEKYESMWYGRGKYASKMKLAPEPEKIPVPDEKKCKKLKKLYDQGKLSKKEVDRQQANICAKKFPRVWFRR